ncbi:MAG TPA: hypothetical protein VMB25_01895 [Bryobacteraceae bacterium]|nr:hypothetical protein [Bryobacteraceae bacterium]
MKLVRLLPLAGFVLLGATWLQADTVEPGHFTIDLNNPGETDQGGWVPDQVFNDEVNPDVNTSDFVSQGQSTSVSCQQWDNWWWDWWHQYINMNQCEDWDPYILVNPGGHSDPFPSSFMADANGGGIQDFYNGTGSPITSILFTIANFQPGTYVCGGTLFDNCGIAMDGTTLEILYWDNPGDFVPSVPEPSLGIVLLVAFCALAGGRKILARKAAA